MYNAVLVRNKRTWSFDCGDWNRDVARFEMVNVRAERGKENVKLVTLDNDKPETIERCLDGLNSLEYIL